MFLRDGKMELRSRSFWTEVFAEFLATLLFLFMVCGTVLPWNYSPPSVMHIAFSHGLSIATLAMSILHISGGQLNPAVTISMMAVGRVSMLKALFFIIAQCTGAICGAAIVYGITPSQSVGALGVTAPANDVTTAQAFVTELVLTYILVFAIFAVTDPSRGMTGYGVPLAIGITVFICLMHGIPSSGASLNPARSLGPAVIMNSWKDHWVRKQVVDDVVAKFACPNKGIFYPSANVFYGILLSNLSFSECVFFCYILGTCWPFERGFY
ncbi:aquaporin-5-like isoform X2 [Orbicella faveolata]|uniref:aquaporin-5-like isoform X2 n=1 Tax=Orbicella faveolata TaxID=48498 RepID=UPI0009E53EFD|nr:aquaporin-5-like isoform X2 [Orbicella faveolata]